MANVTFDKATRQRAKRDQKPLVCLHVDERHVKGSKWGSASYHYSATPEQAEEVRALLQKHLQENVQQKDGA